MGLRGGGPHPGATAAAVGTGAVRRGSREKGEGVEAEDRLVGDANWDKKMENRRRSPDILDKALD